MSSDFLPKTVDPRKLAAAEMRLSGLIPRDDLERVNAVAAEKGCTDAVAASIDIARNDEGKIEIGLQLDTRVDMVCQRCMDTVAVEVSASSSLVVVAHDEEAKALRGNSDPLLLGEDGQLDVHELVEDEILLSLPMIARHADQDKGCTPYSKESGAESDTDPDRDSVDDVVRRSDVGEDAAFAGLAGLLNGGEQ